MRSAPALIALLSSACVAQAQAAAPPGDALRVEVPERRPGTVTLVDAATSTPVATDAIEGAVVRNSLVSPDDTVVAIRYGTAQGEGLAAYAVAWKIDPASGRKLGTVSRVLEYRPRDGRLNLSIQRVPNGTVIRAESGLHVPLWRKTFFYDAAARTWYEWPRALQPQDGTEGVPKAVGEADTGAAYAAWLRPLDAGGH